MKTRILITYFLVCLFSFITSAQDKEKKKTQTNAASKSDNRPLKKDNFLIDITYSSLINAPENVNFNFGYGNDYQIFYDHTFKVNVLSGAIGIGYAHAKYFNNGYTIQYDTATGNDYATFLPISADSSYKRNSYTTNYFDIPVELRYRSMPNEKGHSWKLAIGFRVGFKIGGYTTTWTENGRYSDFIQPQLTNNRYGLTFRAGYGRIGLVGYYGISKLFEEEKGHQLIPFSLGITISPF